MSSVTSPTRTLEIRNPQGWTVKVEGDRVTITGGAHADAYAPVELEASAIPALVADILAATRAAVAGLA